MHTLWEDLAREGDSIESPAWHGDVLRETEERVRAGTEHAETGNSQNRTAKADGMRVYSGFRLRSRPGKKVLRKAGEGLAPLPRQPVFRDRSLVFRRHPWKVLPHRLIAGFGDHTRSRRSGWRWFGGCWTCGSRPLVSERHWGDAKSSRRQEPRATACRTSAGSLEADRLRLILSFGGVDTPATYESE